jgi:hypothetical protein
LSSLPSASGRRRHDLTIGIVAMLCYTLLAAEFLLRVYYRNPINRQAQVSSPATPNDKSWKEAGGYLPFRISLMVLGLALSTVFVFVRFVGTFYDTCHPLTDVDWHSEQSTVP